MIRVFYLYETNLKRLFLRRYADGPCALNQGQHSYHNAMHHIGDADTKERSTNQPPEHDDPRWPTQCGCGYTFKNTDTWQLFTRSLYHYDDSRHLTTLEDAPVGACWDSPWLKRDGISSLWKIGSDGLILTVKTPGGDWCIDSKANNCTDPEENTHCCWVRHGSPKDGTLHVDKNGHTCSAGAGSISLPTYHGFLHNGHLITC